jgi:hypothetical protein
VDALERSHQQSLVHLLHVNPKPNKVPELAVTLTTQHTRLANILRDIRATPCRWALLIRFLILLGRLVIGEPLLKLRFLLIDVGFQFVYLVLVHLSGVLLS